MTLAFGGHERTPNRAELRYINSTLANESWVEKTEVFPSNRPDSIVLHLITEYYPPELVAGAYLQIRSYTNGDFHISYVEDHHGTEWMCRWDRHDSPEYSRDHFHAPPNAQHEDGENRTYPDSVLEALVQEIVPWLYDRMGAVWEGLDGSTRS